MNNQNYTQRNYNNDHPIVSSSNQPNQNGISFRPNLNNQRYMPPFSNNQNGNYIIPYFPNSPPLVYHHTAPTRIVKVTTSSYFSLF